MNGQDAFNLVLEKLEERNEQIGRMDQRLETMRAEILKLERQVQILKGANEARVHGPAQPVTLMTAEENPF